MRLAAKVLKPYDFRFILALTISLSIECITRSNFISTSLHINSPSLLLRTAPHNSSLTMFITFNGATREFAAIMREFYTPLLNYHRQYATAPYAWGEPSENISNAGCPTHLFGVNGLLTCTCTLSTI